MTSKANEEVFHDQWAAGEDLESIDVIAANEAQTSPELRTIFASLGPLQSRSVLDVGCGLGEASVYFAIRGAHVTATDLSQGMLDATQRLATRNGVKVTTHKSDAENLGLGDATFDIIYVGNLFHHVDIPSTLERLKKHLKPDGVLASWDPLAYNPIINVYRRIATEVRTVDEHPLTVADLRLFRLHFGEVNTRYFWLTSLLIFILMVLVQRRNPNKVRLWKAVVLESKSWEPIYRPLAALDQLLLKLLPPLRLLCWNVVILAKAPIR
jgi:SAM-dependent methyltransferase